MCFHIVRQLIINYFQHRYYRVDRKNNLFFVYGILGYINQGAGTLIGGGCSAYGCSGTHNQKVAPKSIFQFINMPQAVFKLYPNHIALPKRCIAILHFCNKNCTVQCKFVQAINLINFGFCENYIFVARYYSCYCIHNRNFCDCKKTIACNCKICFAIMVVKSNSYNAMVQCMYYMCIFAPGRALSLIFQIFKKLHASYVDMFCNPFYTPNAEITSK